MMRLSIRWRLTLWYGIALAIMLCGFCLLLLLFMRQQMFARTDAGLQEEIKEIRVEIGLAESTTSFRTAAESRFTQHAFYEFLVSDAAGRVIFASSKLNSLDKPISDSSPGSTQTAFTNVHIDHLGLYRIAQTSAESRLGVLNIQVMSPLAPLYADLSSLQWAMTGLLPLGILLALAVGHFLAERALAPVQKVVDVANSINITCLDRRIEVPHAHDEIGQLASALNSLIARLEQAVSEIRRFTADASHEIRTPIAALRAEAEMALRSPRSPEEYAQALEVVVDEAIRLGRLTDQLLHLSRHDAGITLNLHEPVQLDALLPDVVDQLQPLAKIRGIALHCESDLPAEVLGDDIRLSQVFFNVVENAIKYTPAGGSVAVRLRETGKEAVVDVEDSGIGISPQDLPRIFERFYRADPSRQSEGGAGLGLSIAKTVVAEHRGLIDVSSQPGAGTKVTIRLPKSSYDKLSISAQTELAQAT